MLIIGIATKDNILALEIEDIADKGNQSVKILIVAGESFQGQVFIRVTIKIQVIKLKLRGWC